MQRIALYFCDRLTNANFDMDRSSNYRKIDPHSYGMYPLRSALRTILIFAGENMFISGFNTVRVVSLVVALTSPTLSNTWVAGWLCAEFGVYVLAKCVDGSWAWWVRNNDTFLGSWTKQIILYVVISTAPCTWLHHPLLACPHIYAGTVCVSLVSSLAMVVTVFHSDVPKDDVDGMSWATLGAYQFSKDQVWGVLAIGLGAVAFGLILMFSSMEKTFRKSFYVRMTPQRHVEHHLWKECTFTLSAFGSSRNDARARTLTRFATRYWPAEEKVKRWILEHWDEWNTPARRYFAEHFFFPNRTRCVALLLWPGSSFLRSAL